jgi:DNA-nicking Smr family endonuclease
MTDVAPLTGRARVAAAPTPPATEPTAQPVIRRPATQHEQIPALGLDRRTADRLRRGALPIAARLDLHGMTQERAHGALQDFLHRAEERGQRCVLVITGKGQGAAGGILKQAVPRWLAEAPNRARVLAAVPALPKDGGGGALYVLVRRKR